MLEIILIAVAIAAASGGATAFALRRRRRRAEATAALPAHRRLDRGELKPADVVVHLGADYLVEGVAAVIEEGSPRLVIARFGTDGEGRRQYLCVRPGAARPCALLSPLADVELAGSVPNQLLGDGGELRLVARLAARLTVDGELPALAEGPCEVGRYEGPGSRVGVVVGGGESAELVLAGRVVTAAGLTLLPAGD